MIDPLASTPPPAPALQPLKAADAPPPVQAVTPVPATASTSADPNPTPSRRQLSVDVQKADDGVFVYTLTDPDTGAIVAVVPRHKIDGSQQGQRIDTKA